MSKFGLEEIKYLRKWCDKAETQYSRFYFEVKKNGRIYVYRYDSGEAKPGNINIFNNNEELVKFIEEDKAYKKFLQEENEELERRMNI